MQNEMETSDTMEDTSEYEAKLEHVRGHAAFLHNVLRTIKEKTEKKPETQQNYPNLKIDKIESLHKLLTNKNKKLSLPVLNKCEDFVTSLKKKLKISDSPGQGSLSPIPSDTKPKPIPLSAPASPPPSSDVDIEKREPIIIPTERCDTFPPQNQKLPQQNDRPFDRDNRFQKRPGSPRDICRPVGRPDPFDNRHMHEKYNQNHPHHRMQQQQQHHRHQQPPPPQHSFPPLPPPPRVPLLLDFPNPRPGPPQQMNPQMPPRPLHFMQQQCGIRSGFPMNPTPQIPTQPYNMRHNYPPPQIGPHPNNMQWAPPNIPQPQPRAVNLQNLVTVPINESIHRNAKKANDFVKSPSPIVDVLKSPPLTADDIDDLLHDTGASDVVSHQSKKDFSKPALTDFESVRQKFNKYMLSSNRQSSPITSSPKVSFPEVNTPNTPSDTSDRIANKYNPHRRKVPSDLEHPPAPVPAPIPPLMSTPAPMPLPVPPPDPRNRLDVRIDPRLSKQNFLKPVDPRLRNDPRISNFQSPESGMMQQSLPNFLLPQGCDSHTPMSPGISGSSVISPMGRILPSLVYDEDNLPRTPIYTEPSFNNRNMNNMNQHHMNPPFKWVSSGPVNSPRNSFQTSGDNKFHPMLNDQHERMQYLNSRKRKSEDNTPKTYGEYREAKRLAEMEKRRRSDSACSSKPRLDNDNMDSTSRTTDDENKKRRTTEERDTYNDRRKDNNRSTSDRGRRSPDNDDARRDRNGHRKRDDRSRERDERPASKSSVSDRDKKETHEKPLAKRPLEKGRKDEPPKKNAKIINNKCEKTKKNPMRISSDEDWDKSDNEEEIKSTRKDNHKNQKDDSESEDEIRFTRKQNQKKRTDNSESEEEIRVTRRESQKKRRDNSIDGKEKNEKKNTSKSQETPNVDEDNPRRVRRRIKPQQKSKDKFESESSDDDDNVKLSKLIPKKTRNSTGKTEESKDTSSKTVEDIAAPIIETIRSCLPGAGDAAQGKLNLEEILRGALAPLLLQLGKGQANTTEENVASSEKPSSKSEEKPAAVKETKKTPRTRRKKIEPEPEPEPESKEEELSSTLAEADAEEDDEGQNENDNDDDTSAKGRKNRRVRSELDRLQEDTHDMFMLQGGISSTGRRRCTLAKVTYGSPEEVKTKPEPPKVGRGRGRLSRGGNEVSVEKDAEPKEGEIEEPPPAPVSKGRGRPRKLLVTPDASNVEETTPKNTEETSLQKPAPKKNRKKNIWVKTRRRRRVAKKPAIGQNVDQQDADEENDEEHHDEDHLDEDQHNEDHHDDEDHDEEEKELDQTDESKKDEDIVPAEIEAVNIIRAESCNAELISDEETETGKKDEDPLHVETHEIDSSASVHEAPESRPNLQLSLMDEIICGENENNLNVEKERTLLLLAQQQNNVDNDDQDQGAGTSNSREEDTVENAANESFRSEAEPQDVSKVVVKEEKLSEDEFESSVDCSNITPSKDEFKTPPNSAKKRSVPITPQKNIDPEMHCSSHYANKCVYCSYNGRYLSNHYSHHHPESEVLISRLPQETVDRLKSGVGIDIKSTIPKTYRGTLLVHTCPFCDVEKKFNRICWIEHLGTHTGEYTFNCSVCRRPANDKIKIQKHCQAVCSNAFVERNRKLVNAQGTIKAYLCNLCNYIQLEDKNMNRHLETQHEVGTEDNKTEIVILNYPEFGSTSRQRSKNDKKVEPIVIIDPKSPSPPVLDSLNKEQLEVFLPRGDDDLNLDNSMIQLMSEISFSSSGKVSQQPTNSIADKLKKRFRNAEEDESSSVKSQKTPSMADRLTERFKNMKEDEEKEAKADAATTASTPSVSSTIPSSSAPQEEVQDEQEQPEKGEEVVPTSTPRPALDTEDTSNNTKCTESTENDTAETDRADIDDDENDGEWEDIEEIPEPSSVTLNTKKKSNKLYYETVSRLYATLITQPNLVKKTKKMGNSKKSHSVTSNDESSNSCSAFSTVSTTDLNDKRDKTDETNETASPDTTENPAKTLVLNGSVNDKTTETGSESVTKSSGSLLKAALDAGPRLESPKPSCLSLLKAALDLEEDHLNSDNLLSMQRLKTPAKRLSLKDALDLDSSPSENGSLLKAALDSGPLAQGDVSKKNIPVPTPSQSPTPSVEGPPKVAVEVRPRRAEIVTKTVGLKEMKKVENIGFTEKTTDMVECKCLLQGCTFVYVNDLRSVVRHFASNHPTQRWSGFCQTCDKSVETTSDLSIAKELLHINDAHVKGLLEKYKVECKVGNNRTLQVASSSLTLIPFSPLKNRIVGSVVNERSTEKEADAETRVEICSPLKLSTSDRPVTAENTPQVKPADNQIVPSAKVADAPKPTLKVRRFSGDRLSKWEDNNSSPVVPSPPVKVLNSQLAGNFPVNSVTYSVSNLTQPGPSRAKSSGEEAAVPGQKCPLRPWLNSPTRKCNEHIQEMLLSDRLQKFYKCMGDECNFTANLSTEMICHLTTEHKVPQLQQKGESHKYKFLECAYCDMLHMNAEALVNHIHDMHKYDVYQCPYCFYRSISGHNVQLHSKAYHGSKISCVVACCCVNKTPRPNEAQTIDVSRRKNVRKLGCSECSSTFYVIKDFESHLSNAHQNGPMYKCNLCMNETKRALIAGHLLKVHNIGLYECIYCLFASNTLENIGHHLADRHPSRFPVICARLTHRPEFYLDNTDEDQLKNTTVLLNLADIKDNNKLYKICVKENLTDLMSNLEVLNVIRHMKDVFPYRIYEGLALKEVMERYHQKSEEDLQMYDEELKASRILSIINRDKQPREPRVQINNEQISQSNERNRSREEMMEVIEERAAVDKNIRKFVENTGYSNTDIYRCPIEGCKDSFSNAMAFYGHSMRHSRKRSRLRCSFCNNFETTDWKLYRDHVVVHSRHRYFCYYCMKTGYSFVNITQHINNAHDVQDLQMCPLVPNYNNEYEDFYIIAPMDSDSETYMYRVMCHIASKRPELKMYFMPDEINLLPRQAIFLQELYCGIEKYKTKVRTNMLRHMSRHANEDNVQAMKQDAVNPVPCLESNERHFDKMTNLACSSFESKGGKKDSSKNALPAFIDEPCRYVCGAPNCNYLTVNCEMLKCHLNTLHSSEKNYTCPHCKREVSRGRLCADKIIQHLKFHDTNLFACSVCRKVHYFRHVIERHIQEKHGVDVGFVLMYSRTKDLTTQSIQNVKCDNITNTTDLNFVGKQKKTIWACSLCDLKLKTRLQMELHAKNKHNVVNQFSCRHCNAFVKNIAEHTKARHPNLLPEAQCFYTREIEETKTETIISPARIESSPVYDTTPLWRRDPNKIKSIRGILFEDDSPVTNSRKPKVKAETTPVPKYSKISNSSSLKCTIFDDNSRFCHDCNYVAVSTERLIDHIKVAHNYPLNEFIYYYGRYKFKCVQCDRDEKFTSVRKFHLHYERYHIHPESLRIPSQLKLFSLCKIYTCYLCKETGTHDEIKRHYSMCHGNQQESLILRDGTNFTKCGLCDFKYYSPNHIDTLKEHFLTHHKNTDIKENEDLPYICIPREVLSYHMQEDALHIRCIRCNTDFSHETDYDAHHSKFHSASAKSFKILRLVNYVCPECFKQFQLHESVLRHVCRQHSKISSCIFNSEYKIKETEKVFKKCERILVVFPSGLTLRRGDLQNTEYGNVEHVKSAIADIENFTTTTISPKPTTPPIVLTIKPKPVTLKTIQTKTIWVNLNNDNCDTITYQEFLKTHKELRVHIERLKLEDLPDRIRCQTDNNTFMDNIE